MKKLIYLFLALMSSSAISQTGADSILQLRMELGLNLTVIEPGEDPDGAQARPCGTVINHLGTCCYRYEVVCGGEVKWKSQIFCDNWCLAATQNDHLGTVINGFPYVVATPGNPVTVSTPLDMSFFVEEGVLNEEEINAIREYYSNFYFELENDILIDYGGSYILYKAGNYKIKKGKMTIRFYYTAY